VQVSKQMCDVVVLPWFINKVRRGIHHGLKATFEVRPHRTPIFVQVTVMHVFAHCWHSCWLVHCC